LNKAFISRTPLVNEGKNAKKHNRSATTRRQVPKMAIQKDEGTSRTNNPNNNRRKRTRRTNRKTKQSNMVPIILLRTRIRLAQLRSNNRYNSSAERSNKQSTKWDSSMRGKGKNIEKNTQTDTRKITGVRNKTK